jgi:hypothetical protein
MERGKKAKWKKKTISRWQDRRGEVRNDGGNKKII